MALLAAPAGAAGIVGLLWMWVAALLGAAVLVGVVRRCAPGGATLLWRLAALLPRAERRSWRCCMPATPPRNGAGRVRGFLAATPGTVLTSWRTHRGRR